MSEQPPKKPFNHRKYPNTKTKCIGCGFMNTWTDRQPVCIYHTPENLAKLQKKLNSPVVEFVSKKSNGRSQGACELVTLMEMIVIPELEPEELFKKRLELESDLENEDELLNAFREIMEQLGQNEN
jgi:hypothetical protein